MRLAPARRLRVAIGIFAALTLLSGAAIATTPPHRQMLALPPRDQAFASNGVGFYTLPPGLRPTNQIYPSHFRHARPSYAWRRQGMKHDLIGYNSQIQHVVVIYMENRSPENLFGAYWNTTNPATHNTFGQDLDVVNPATVTPAPLIVNSLGAPFDPDHSHLTGFVNNVLVPGVYPTPWSSPGLVDTQLSPSKAGNEGVFSVKTQIEIQT
jgi:phospholipase C